MRENRKTFEGHIHQLTRLIDRQVICANEFFHKLLFEVKLDIVRFGTEEQTEELLELIPTLPASVQTKLEKYVCGPDDRIFCRNILCNPGSNPPDGWRHPPAQLKAEANYLSEPISILIHCSDGSSFSIPPDNIYRNLIFATRNYFDPDLNSFRASMQENNGNQKDHSTDDGDAVTPQDTAADKSTLNTSLPTIASNTKYTELILPHRGPV